MAESDVEEILEAIRDSGTSSVIPDNEIETILTYMLNSESFSGRTHSRVAELLKEITNQGGGGGNPNSIQTVNGTLDNPWGDLNYSELVDAIGDHNASATISFNASALGAGTFVNYLYSDAGTGDLSLEIAKYSETVHAGVRVGWGSSGALTNAYMDRNGTLQDMSSYASLLTTHLTVIWHPLPNG